MTWLSLGSPLLLVSVGDCAINAALHLKIFEKRVKNSLITQYNIFKVWFWVYTSITHSKIALLWHCLQHSPGISSCRTQVSFGQVTRTHFILPFCGKEPWLNIITWGSHYISDQETNIDYKNRRNAFLLCYSAWCFYFFLLVTALAVKKDKSLSLKNSKIFQILIMLINTVNKKKCRTFAKVPCTLGV